MASSRLEPVPWLTAPGEPQTAKEILEDYLDHLAAHLVGRIPASERLRLKDEAAFHLERLADLYQNDGLAPEKAISKAIAQYGRPFRIADEFVKAHFENQSASRIYRGVGRANFTAFAYFGLAHLLFMIVLQLRVFLPNGAAYALPLSPGDARILLPDPLPLPQSMSELTVLYGYPLVAPVVAGWLTGRVIPAGAARAAMVAQMPLVIYSFVVGVLTLPQTAGLLLAMIQLVWWIPVGAVATWLSSSVSGRRRAIREERHEI